jgi:hypothetical protein
MPQTPGNGKDRVVYFQPEEDSDEEGGEDVPEPVLPSLSKASRTNLNGFEMEAMSSDETSDHDVPDSAGKARRASAHRDSFGATSTFDPFYDLYAADEEEAGLGSIPSPGPMRRRFSDLAQQPVDDLEALR